MIMYKFFLVIKNIRDMITKFIHISLVKNKPIFSMYNGFRRATTI